MPSQFTRRRFLGGLAGGGVLTATGYEFLPASVLPNPLLELRTKHRSVPKVDTSLPVAPEAIDRSRSHLRDIIDRGEAAWERVDDSDVDSQDEDFDTGLENTLDTAREQLSESKGKDATTDTLRDLRYGVNRGAWSLAAAKSIAENYEVESLRKRSKRLYRDIGAFAESMSYEVADPRGGVAYLFRTERGINFARMNSYGKTYFSGEQLAKSEYDHREVVATIRGAIEGRRWLGDAEAMYDAHRTNVADGDSTTDLESHLDRAWRDFADRIEKTVPDRETAIERYFTDDEGPRERGMNELFNNGYSAADDASPPAGELRDGLLALAAVEHAKALQHALGFESAVERLDTAFENDAVDVKLVARTKAKATGRLNSLLEAANDPMMRELAARPREEIVIGDWSLGIHPTFESEYPYAEAYAMNLLAAQNLRHTPKVRDLLLP